MNPLSIGAEEQAVLDKCEAVGNRVLKLVRDEVPEVAVGSLMEVLKVYADHVPDLRFTLGRALLILGGRFTTTPADPQYAEEQLPAANSTIH